MKNILFIANGPLKDPIRGTPIRINNFLSQISKKHHLTVCADNMEDITGVDFSPFPHHRLKGLWQLIKLVREKKIDVIFITSELLMPLVVILKIMTGAKIAIDLHGLYFEEWYYYDRISYWSKLIREFQVRFWLLFFNLVFVVSGKLKNYYKYNNYNIEVIYGGVDLDIFPLPLAQLTDELIIGYMGNTRPYQGLDNLLAVVKEIKDERLFDFKLNLIISGDEKEFYQLLDSYGLKENSIINFNVKHELVGDLMSRSDVLVISRPSLKMTEYAFPSKLTEYLATGVSTIVTDVGPVEELLSNYGCCLIIDHLKIKESLKKELINVQSLGASGRSDLGRRGRKFVADFLNWNILGEKINDKFSKL